MIVGFFAEHETFRDVMHRLRRLLIGDDAGPEARVRTAMLIAAISGAVMHPFVVGLDDDIAARRAAAPRPTLPRPTPLSRQRGCCR